jgi:hypothetical protein
MSLLYSQMAKLNSDLALLSGAASRQRIAWFVDEARIQPISEQPIRIPIHSYRGEVNKLPDLEKPL